ncbi:MAG: ketopantoate reductase family protein [Candidatus Methylumidiphilus sp.]
MNKPVAIIGMGEMGELFAHAFLKLGHPVYPIVRGMDLASIATALPDPELVLVAVGENQLHGVLNTLPSPWRGRLALLQNELLPRDWQQHGITDPTVIVVWFDKKPGRPFVAATATPVCGPKAELIAQALETLAIPCHTVPRTELLYELARKNLYILTINIAGLMLAPGGTVGELWDNSRDLADKVAADIISVQQALAECELPRKRLLDSLPDAIADDPGHLCLGRSARERLRRTLQNAQAQGIRAPSLKAIAETLAAQHGESL